MIDLLSSFGMHQLKFIEKYHKIRTKQWELYNQAFKDNTYFSVPAPIPKDIKHARHLYAIILNTDKLKNDRNQFIEALKAENIGTGIHFTPLHLHKYYRQTYNFKIGDFPNAEKIGNNTISLPLGPSYTDRDILDVITAVNKVVDFYKK
jgi:dTDP-4-amino-4,6-dideoxygalactose transaminase